MRHVYVVEPYRANGGTFMAYHLARILDRDFGFAPVAVGAAEPSHGMFDYEALLPHIPLDALEGAITDDDLLLANPSFSRLSLGLRCRGRKIMYVQGFNTFSLLDCRFHHYVSASRFVKTYIERTYGIRTKVIMPFIDAGHFPAPIPWAQRPAGSILVSQKEAPPEILAHLRALLPQTDFGTVLEHGIPHRELVARLGQVRTFLTLSPAEGFGLMPLEAMAMGTTVVGFDGFGGREYMRPGRNCAVVAYADMEGLAQRLKRVGEDLRHAARLAAAGHATGRSDRYSYARFRSDWGRYFRSIGL